MEMENQAEKAERDSDLGRVAEIRYGSLPAAEASLKQTIEKLKDYEKQGKRLVREEIGSEDIAEVVSKWTPPGSVKQNLPGHWQSTFSKMKTF